MAKIPVEKSNTEEIMFKLSQRFPEKDIQWRVQRLTKHGTSGMALAYINVRQLQDRLNEVMGANWQSKHEVFGTKTICHLGLFLEDKWVWRSDGAGDTQFEADKGAISDCFSTIVLPPNRAGITLSTIWLIGQFQGVISAQTPIGEKISRSFGA